MKFGAQQALETELLFLKELQDDLVNDYLAALSPVLCTILAIPCLEAEREYVIGQIEKVEKNSTFFFCIFEKFSHLLIGAIEIRSKAYRGQLYTWIHENFWGTGYYQEAMLLAIPEYFRKFPQEDHFNARVDISNQRSYHALKKIGFIETGIFRGAREDQYNLIFQKPDCKTG